MLIRNGEIAAAKNVKFSIAFSPFCFVFLSTVTSYCRYMKGLYNKWVHK